MKQKLIENVQIKNKTDGKYLDQEQIQNKMSRPRTKPKSNVQTKNITDRRCPDKEQTKTKCPNQEQNRRKMSRSRTKLMEHVQTNGQYMGETKLISCE